MCWRYYGSRSPLFTPLKYTFWVYICQSIANFTTDTKPVKYHRVWHLIPPHPPFCYLKFFCLKHSLLLCCIFSLQPPLCVRSGGVKWSRVSWRKNAAFSLTSLVGHAFRGTKWRPQRWGEVAVFEYTVYKMALVYGLVFIDAAIWRICSFYFSLVLCKTGLDRCVNRYHKSSLKVYFSKLAFDADGSPS